MAANHLRLVVDNSRVSTLEARNVRALPRKNVSGVIWPQAAALVWWTWFTVVAVGASAAVFYVFHKPPALTQSR